MFLSYIIKEKIFPAFPYSMHAVRVGKTYILLAPASNPHIEEFAN